jgi:hypothetical protein
MNDLNKVVAFFVGLFVIILVIGFVVSRVRKNSPSISFGGSLGKIFGLSAKATPTPKPIDMADSTIGESVILLNNKAITPTPKKEKIGRQQIEGTEQIPETGSMVVLPALLALGGGILIKRKAD